MPRVTDASTAAAASTAPPAIDLPLCRDAGVRHVGVVFVHGIGSQAQGEILREWGDAITQVLVDFRVASGIDGDPVLATQLDPTAPGRIFVELQLPETDGEPAIPEEHWLLTEAWWAHEITPPTFGSMARWLGPGGAVPRIVKTIIPRSSAHDDPRALAASPEPAGVPLSPVEDLAVRAAAAPPDMRERARRAMRDLRAAPRAKTRDWLVELGAWAYLQAAGALLLLVYGVLRSIESLIPIGPLANGALTRPIDRFVLEWFGDVFVLLTVPTQAASVRGRLTRAIDDLRTAGADAVVVIAHSGGAIVSWTTLVDDEQARVDQLVTIGEGLNLGWNITSGNGTNEDQAALLESAHQRFRLLYESLMRAQPDLTWVDYWGSRDPAPSGPLDPPDPDLQPPRERFTSMPVWNLGSFREDHGGYWDNDEEFVIPLLGRLAAMRPGGGAGFGDREAHALRSNRRRRRVAVRSVWGQLCLVAPMAAIVTSFVAGSDLISQVADAVAGVWSAIPGSDLVSDPLNTIRAADLTAIAPIDLLAEVGVWVVGALILSVMGFALISPPERPIPWSTATSRPGRTIGWLVANGPYLAAVPIVVVVATAVLRFTNGATPSGDRAFIGGLAGLIVAGGAVLLLYAIGRRWVAARIIATAAALAIVTALLLAPILAVLVFEDVGQIVLGSVAIVVGFAILAQVGLWRWSTWDLRERAASHAPQPVYETIGTVAVQCVVMIVSLGLLFVAVAFDLPVVAGIGIVLALVAVFVGIGIDVAGAPRPRPKTGERGAAPAPAAARPTIDSFTVRK